MDRSSQPHTPIDMSALAQESAEVEYRPPDLSAAVQSSLMKIEGVEGVSLGDADTVLVFVTDLRVGADLPDSIDGKAIEVRVTGSIDAR